MSDSNDFENFLQHPEAVKLHDEKFVSRFAYDLLKAKCEAYEQVLEDLIKHVSEWASADMIDDVAVQARAVLEKYRGRE